LCCVLLLLLLLLHCPSEALSCSLRIGEGDDDEL
jgi:hypothetical protein